MRVTRRVAQPLAPAGNELDGEAFRRDRKTA